MFIPFKRVRSWQRLLSLSLTWTAILVGWLFINQRNLVIPTPFEVARSWVALIQAGLLVRLVESYTLNLQGLFWSTLISCGLAYLTVIQAARPGVALLGKLRFLGFTGLTFTFGLYASDRPLQILLLVFGTTVFFVASMRTVVAAVSQEDIDHARTLGMGAWRTTWEVVIRGTLDESLDVLRQTAAMGWMMLTMVEGLVRSQGGVGIMLIDLNRRLDLAGVFAVQLSILCLGMAQDWLITRLRLGLCPYSQRKEE